MSKAIFLVGAGVVLLLATMMMDLMGSAPAAVHPEHAPNELQQEIPSTMREIKRLLKKLDGTIESKKEKEESLDTIRTVQERFLKAKAATPPRALKLKGKKRDKFMAAYVKLQIDVIKKTLDMEKAVMDGKLKAAKKILSQIRASKGKGHGKFK